MSSRFRGATYKTLVSRLPRNLVVFDGHCLMSQARVKYVLERNFNYFKMIPYFMGNEGDMVEQLDRHRMHFLSFDLSEAAELRKLFIDRKKSGSSTAKDTTQQERGKGAAAAAAAKTTDELILMFVEKVPSKSSAFLMGKRASANFSSGKHVPLSSSTSATTSADELFQNPTTNNDCYASFSGGNVVKKKNPVNVSANTVSSQWLQNPETTDLIVSTNFAALCRVGMHLDRWLVRSAFRCVYYVTPRALGDWWFRTCVQERRGVIWGTSELDAVQHVGSLEGMRERRWSWRTRYPS